MAIKIAISSVVNFFQVLRLRPYFRPTCETVGMGKLYGTVESKRACVRLMSDTMQEMLRSFMSCKSHIFLMNLIFHIFRFFIYFPLHIFSSSYISWYIFIYVLFIHVCSYMFICSYMFCSYMSVSYISLIIVNVSSKDDIAFKIRRLRKLSSPWNFPLGLYANMFES